MLNYIWIGMIILGIVYGMFTGNIEDVGNAMLDSSKEAITLCITMLGVMAFWCGMMESAKCSGIIARLTRKIQPFVIWMFPNIPKHHKANEYITTNIIANVLGLGWAATPAGLMAMEELAKLNKDKDCASDEMCTFLVLNISSLQLIPVQIIAYRSQYGSVAPASIVIPAIIATSISTLAGILYCKKKMRH